MKNYKSYLESLGHSQKTIQTYYTNTFYFLNWLEDEELQAENCGHNEIIAYMQHFKKREVQRQTIQSYLLAAKHYFNWQIKNQLRTDNPIHYIKVQGVRKRKLYDILPKKELEQLYHNFTISSNEENYKRNKVMLGLMIYQGLGTTELNALQVKHLKLREGKIEVPGSRKSNPRTLDLHAHQILELMEYNLSVRTELLQQSGEETERLLVSREKATHLRGIIYTLMKQVKAQYPKVSSAKQIRCSVITGWLKQYNLREVQYMAGHRYVSSTEAYKINDLEDLQEDITKFHPL